MNKFGMILGVAAVVTVAGCKDPDYQYGPGKGPNQGVSVDTTPVVPVDTKPVAEPIPVAPVTTVTPVTPVTPVKPTCQCLPGTRHSSPCKCGAPDCRCIVEIDAPTTVYVVQRGDYLAKISKKFNIRQRAILAANPGLNPDRIRVGQKIVLPGKLDVPAAAPVAASEVKPVAPKAKVPAAKKPYAPYVGPTKDYTIQNGDSLSLIASKNGLSTRQLKELNVLKDNNIRAGRTLKVPASAADAAKFAAAAPAAPQAEKKPAEAAVADPAKAEPAELPGAKVEPVAAPVEPVAAKPNTYVVQEGEDLTSLSITYNVSVAAIRELNGLREDEQIKAGQTIKLPIEQ